MTEQLPNKMHGHLADVSPDVQRAVQYLRFDRDADGELLIRGYDLTIDQFEIVGMIIDRGLERRILPRGPSLLEIEV